MSNLKDISPTICPWPWTTIHVATNSFLSHCCEARDLPLSAQDTSLQSFWNSDEIKNVRATMLAGKWHKSCDICTKREKNNIRSKRQMAVYKAGSNGWHGYTTEQIKDLPKVIRNSLKQKVDNYIIKCTVNLSKYLQRH